MMYESNSHTTSDLLTQRIAQLSPAKRAALQQRLNARRRHGADLTAEALQQCGVTHLYGVAGLPTQSVLPAAAGQGIRPIGVYHQSSAVCMALAQNYQAGRLAAAALVSAGPAVTNAMTGLLVARDNGWPVIVLGGQNSSFQQLNAFSALTQLTKHAVHVSESSAIGRCIHDAARIAVSGRPGPVYVELHEDVLARCAVNTPVPEAIPERTSVAAPTASDADMKKIAAALLSARRPALLLGKGVRWTVAPSELRRLVERLALPLITSPMGRGFVPDDHALCFNRARPLVQSQADVVLVLGARLNWVFRHGAELAREATVFRVDIDPVPEDDTAVKTQVIRGDAGDFVRRLMRFVDSCLDDAAAAERQRVMGPWLEELRAASKETQRWLDRQTCSDCRPMSTYRMMKEVRRALPRNAICVTEGHISMLAAQAVIPAFRPAARMDAGANGCMGVGIPFAIGAKVACPNRPVVAVVGDYGFSLSAMELEVCLRHKIAVVVIVANNQGNCGAIKQKTLFQADDAERVAMFQSGIEYDRIMKMFGGAGTTITDPNTLKDAVMTAIASGTPSCINVVVDPDAPQPAAWGEQVAIGEESEG